MGFFSQLLGLEKTEDQEVKALITISENFIKQTTEDGNQAPYVLKFSLQDSFFRYSIFSLSAVHFSTIGRVKNPVSVFQTALVLNVNCAIEMPGKYCGKIVARNDLEEIGATIFFDFLKSWKEFCKLSTTGQMNHAVRNICVMLRSTEAESGMVEDDFQRLSPLANWILTKFGDMAEAFDKMP